jgi:FixJ family two-component response regulator
MDTPSGQCFIVDDDLSFGRSLKRLLNMEGFTACHFASAQCFLDSVHPGQLGYAIVDIHMPDFDGFMLMDKMRELHYHMPIIAISGQTQPDTRNLAMKRGAVGFLQKPFSAESLFTLLSQDSRVDDQD